MAEFVKNFVTYCVPIVSLIFSGISLWEARKISKMEEKIREYDTIIKEAEVKKIKEEQEKVPTALIDGRVTKVSDGKYKLYIFNKGDAAAYNVDYEIEKGSCLIVLNKLVPFEKLEPGQHFEEAAMVYPGITPKFKITLKWKEENGNKSEKEYFKGIE